MPSLPPEARFIKIKFIHRGLHLLNISNIFGDHGVTQYFENLGPPLVCSPYKYLFEALFLTITKLLLILMFWISFGHRGLVRTLRFCARLRAMLSRAAFVVSAAGDWGRFSGKGPNTDFHPRLI